MSEMNAESRAKLNRTPEWLALGKHREEFGQTHLRELFEENPGREPDTPCGSATCTSTTRSTS